MKLVYTKTLLPVKEGDEVKTRTGHVVTVVGWRKPHKPSSTGRVCVQYENRQSEFFPSVIEAHWIE